MKLRPPASSDGRALDHLSLTSADPGEMGKTIEALPDHLQHAWRLAKKFPFPASRPHHLLITGMGGSAIGGDLLRALVQHEMKIPCLVWRDYGIPGWVNSRTLVLISSYSGETEEALSSYREARKRNALVIAFSSGGTLGEMARREGLPHFSLPTGIQPRAAIGYSFLPLYLCLQKMRLIGTRDAEIGETITLLEKLRRNWGMKVPGHKNRAKRLALLLQGKVPAVYGASQITGVVALRWKCQLNENSKIPAVWNLFPELSHNEIVGFSGPGPFFRDMAVVILRNPDDHPRVQARVNLTKEIMKKKIRIVEEVWAQGSSSLARMFSLLYLGDFVSLYLAFLQKEDPTPVRVITWLKKELAKIP